MPDATRHELLLRKLLTTQASSWLARCASDAHRCSLLRAGFCVLAEPSSELLAMATAPARSWLAAHLRSGASSHADGDNGKSQNWR
jgi:hypothetical protein